MFPSLRPRALYGPDRLVACRGQALPAQAAPHDQEGLRRARRGAGLRGVVLDRAEVREEEEGRAGGRARRARGAGAPTARPGARRVPGGLRPGGLPRAGRHHAGALPHGRAPVPRRRALPGVLGRDGRVLRRGFRDVLGFPGGVPLRAVSGNVAEVGRRVGAEIRPRRRSAASRRTTGWAAASPTPAQATRRGPWRTRRARSGGASSCRRPRSPT